MDENEKINRIESALEEAFRQRLDRYKILNLAVCMENPYLSDINSMHKHIRSLAPLIARYVFCDEDISKAVDLVLGQIVVTAHPGRGVTYYSFDMKPVEIFTRKQSNFAL